MTKHVVLWLAGCCLAVALGGGVLAREGGAAPATAGAGGVPDTAQVRQRMSALAVPFEANTGQQDERVAFTAHTFDGTMFVTTAGQLVYSVYGRTPSGHDKRDRGPGWALTETLVGAHPVVRGGAASTIHINRFIGNDPSRWQTSIPTFDRVALGEAWPGITVELAARANNVEKFFTVAPGADPWRIAVRLDGAERLELDADGALVAHTGNGPVSFTAPRAWQDIKGERKAVRVAYALAGDSYGFGLGDYDPAFPVVIDPLKQSTYLGGSGDDGAHAIAVDAASGNVFVTGYTMSPFDLPVTTGAQPGGGAIDAFVAAFDNTLTQAIAVTYLGGNGFDEGLAIKVDGTGNVFVAGPTRSTNFPVTAGVAQSAIGGGSDAFVAKFNSNLVMLAATFLGGGGHDTANAIALDTTNTNGNVFVTGYTTGSLPAAYLTGTAQPAYAGGTNDAFVARLDSNLTTIQATYLGGGDDDLGRGIAFDANGYVFVTGQTRSTNFIGAQNGSGGSADAFVAKLATALTGSIQSIYFGGTGNDAGNGIAVNPANGDVFVVGDTAGNLPAIYTANGVQPVSAFTDAFVVKLTNNLTMPPTNATYLGGNADDYGNAIALDAAGNVFVAGVTRSTNFPGTQFGLQSSPGGVSYEHFVARLTNPLTAIFQATYLGTGQEDEAPSLALDSNNYVFVAGRTSSLNFPGKSGGAFAFYAGGAYDAYVSRLTHGLHDLAHQNTPANDDGDPHITTTNGVHYNFQAAGEFIALRDLPGLEIQTRQSPTSTFGPFFDGYTGLTTCVSLNTALAARVGKHRVTYQPNFKNAADPGGLQLRVDGVLTPLTTAGLNLSGGGRVVQTAGALEIDFPDGTVLIAAPGWAAPQWFLNIAVYRSEATEGIMGWIPSGGWLPALPNGTPMGSMPPSNQRYAALNQTFANAWRVNDRTTLFDYARGTSTATFTFAEWPAENGPCVVPDHPKPLKPLDPVRAQEICRPIADKTRNADCVFDVAATGVPDFAKAYQLSQRIEQGGTTITVSGNPTPVNAQMNFTATVALLATGGRTPTGTVQFILNGEKMGEPVRLDARGSAGWKASRKPGEYRLSASYLPSKGSVFLPSSSTEKAVRIKAAR